jgi:ketosteroid isomerase-like protein
MSVMRSHVIVSVAVLACAVTVLPRSELRAMCRQAGEEQLIREARARSNQAIATHDVAGIARVWMENVHIVTSTGVQGAGRALNQQRMARQFTSRPDTIYVRHPTTVDVYSAWAVAAERGEWTGRWAEPDGTVEIAGTYLAQWRKIDGQWLIQAELFVPTRCTGATYCRQHP